LKKLAAASLLCCALVVTAVASAATDGRPSSGVSLSAAPAINWGVADDASKYADDGGSWFYGELAGANLTENRWTLSFDSAAPTTISELPFLQRAAPKAKAAHIHIVLALYGRKATYNDPTTFCAWAAQVASTVKQWDIHDFVVWNEPNTALYWSPQNAQSPAAYEALLARCYDRIHRVDPAARVIGFGLSPRSNGPSQTPPLDFIAAVGAAYRASGRTTPIMDQMSIHPYPNPNRPTDGPDVGYANPAAYGVPNLGRVKQALYDAFHGTGQPTTRNGLTFRIDELGWQTRTTLYPQYYNPENVAVVSEQVQAQDIRETVQKYFACDPTVTDVEWFLLVDEPTRNGRDKDGTPIGGGWQSGLLTAGGEGVSTPKTAYAAVTPLFAEGRAACTAGVTNWLPLSAPGKAKAAKAKGQVKPRKGAKTPKRQT
jgi:hypothetical protein